MDNSFFLETGPGIFERFLVDGFKVGEISLVVEGFAELKGG